ncbi:MAG: CotH kinase family protein, partial [Mariniphaga sp.]|nr:CotH kinase family protein [Mariniphaga sp.]
NKNNSHSFYQFEYPKPGEMTSEQKDYISDYVYSFEKSVIDKDFSIETGYRKYINITSFIDYQIMNELAKNVDAYRLSTFFYKDKNERLNIGPIWDFNLGYGNANFYGGWSEYGFQFMAELGDDSWQNPFYWDEFRKDSYYCSRIVERWQQLRENELSHEWVFFVVDSLVNLISTASGRNFQRWNILGQFVWPNYYVGSSWQAEVNWMKSWLSTRLGWLDTNFPLYFTGERIDPGFLQGELVQVGPNPFKNKLKFYIKSGFEYEATLNIYSSSGVMVDSRSIQLNSGMNFYDYENAAFLAQGVYFYQLVKNDEVLTSGKIVKVY